MHPFGERSAYHAPNDRLHEGAVKREIYLRNARRRFEAALVSHVIASQRTNIVQRSRLAAHDPIAAGEVWIGRVRPLVLQDRLVEAGWQSIDQINIAGKFTVFLLGDPAGNKD